MTNYDDVIGSDSSSSQETDNVCEEVNATEELPIQRGKIHFIDPRLVATLDNCKVSGRYATHLLAAVAVSLGHDVSQLVINRESVRLCRQKYREEMAQQIKDDFHKTVN